MKRNKKNQSNIQQDFLLARLDTIIVLLSELLRQFSKDKTSAQNAREKSAAVLVAGGLTQERTAKLLGMQKKIVVKATKHTKI
ncbi:MAG: hypothetical protein HY507_00640 [Candidatus Zambryskibacteria bacterium]|nr:hypothetical protein [Candidatus Zambryskibacteria bacterium]